MPRNPSSAVVRHEVMSLNNSKTVWYRTAKCYSDWRCSAEGVFKSTTCRIIYASSVFRNKVALRFVWPHQKIDLLLLWVSHFLGFRFSKARTDEISILAPLYQCCQIRRSTAEVLLNLATSPEGRRLGDRLRQAMSDEWEGNPIVGTAHIRALNRRVGIILEHIVRCQTLQPNRTVIIDDGL